MLKRAWHVLLMKTFLLQTFITARCTIVQSAVLRWQVVCPSVCNVGELGPHRLEMSETNCTDIYPNPFALRSPKGTHLLPGEYGKIFGRVKGVGKNGVLEHKSGNISEARTDRGKVTMEGR